MPADRSASTNRRATFMQLPSSRAKPRDLSPFGGYDAVMTTGPTTSGFTDIDRQHWSLRYLPAWARPYGRLARWDRPIGGWLLMLPCWWSAALGSGQNWPNLIGWMALFAIGAIAMRGAGCTWNDIVDRKIDARV